MVMLDSRIGSKELLPLFASGNARLCRLEYGDACFTGNGGDGIPYVIGIERKRVTDLLNCIMSGRLSGHQLIGLLNSYNVVYLVVEGLYRSDASTGLLQLWKKPVDRYGYSSRKGHWEIVTLGTRQFMARDMWAFLNTLEIVAGIHIWYTTSVEETAQWIQALHYWWTNKEYEDHRGHLQAHTQNQVVLTKHTLARRTAAQLKGVGWEKAQVLAKKFVSVDNMVHASEEDWKSVEGIGIKLSRSIHAELRGRKV